jgi:hypothetical protein
MAILAVEVSKMNLKMKWRRFMKKLIARLQKDISKLQDVVHKEGNDLLEKIKHLDLKKNIDFTKKELMHLLSVKLKKMEPSYNNFISELRKSAKKAGIELEKLEKNIKAKAKKAKSTFPKMNKKTKSKAKTASKGTARKKTRKTSTTSVN